MIYSAKPVSPKRKTHPVGVGLPLAACGHEKHCTWMARGFYRTPIKRREPHAIPIADTAAITMFADVLTPVRGDVLGATVFVGQ